jgi:hypothetical protein
MNTGGRYTKKNMCKPPPEGGYMGKTTKDQLIAAFLLTVALIGLVVFTDSLGNPPVLIALVVSYIATLIYVVRWIKNPL